MSIIFDEMSCGGCGASLWRIKAARSISSETFSDIALICSGCGSVTHLLPRSHIAVGWGRTEQGEKDDGVLCHMPWRDLKPGKEE